MFSAIQRVKAYDASFFDFDNDGFLDLFIAGESIVEGQTQSLLIVGKKRLLEIIIPVKYVIVVDLKYMLIILMVGIGVKKKDLISIIW